MDRPDWISRAQPAETARIDVGFLISDTFYFGPENNFTEEEWLTLRAPLYKPRVERYGDFVLSAALSESPAELVRYYQDVVRLVSLHGRKIDQAVQYFWMRPLIYSRGEFAIEFPWYDTWEEAIPLLNSLAATGDGMVFEDLDQGWEVHVFADRDRLFVRQGDFDSGEEHFVVAASRMQFVRQVQEVRQRVGSLLQDLTAELGRDYWSRR